MSYVDCVNWVTTVGWRAGRNKQLPRHTTITDALGCLGKPRDQEANAQACVSALAALRTCTTLEEKSSWSGEVALDVLRKLHTSLRTETKRDSARRPSGAGMMPTTTAEAEAEPEPAAELATEIQLIPSSQRIPAPATATPTMTQPSGITGEAVLLAWFVAMVETIPDMQNHGQTMLDDFPDLILGVINVVHSVDTGNLSSYIQPTLKQRLSPSMCCAQPCTRPNA